MITDMCLELDVDFVNAETLDVDESQEVWSDMDVDECDWQCLTRECRWEARWPACQPWPPAPSTRRWPTPSSLVNTCLWQHFIDDMLYIRRLLCRARCHGCLRQIWTPCSTPIPTMEPGRIFANTKYPYSSFSIAYLSNPGMPVTTSSTTTEWRCIVGVAAMIGH